MLKYRLGAFTALVAGLLVGCGGTNTASKVSGVVTYKGQPVKGGDIRFHTPDGNAYNGTLGQDGAYSISDMPAGTMKVTIDTSHLDPDKKQPSYGAAMKGGGAGASMKDRMKGGTGGGKAPSAAEEKKQNDQRNAMLGQGGMRPPTDEEKRERYTKIPAKYAKTDTSGLTFEVKSGSQKKDFELTD